MGPLAGVKVVELAGLGPAPFAAMLLADLGADVVRIDRAGGGGGVPDPKRDLLNRGKRSLVLDLKSPVDRETVLALCERADVLLEGFRPGVVERLGLGPADVHARNPRLVYGRMTGFGQDGPLAKVAGHDLDYIAYSGALHAMGRAGEAPAVPLNLVGDFGGGGMLLALGCVSALLHARATGEGQVLDASMVEGSALLLTMMHSFLAMGLWRDERGVNLLDSGAHFYETYETKDGRHVALACLEPQFYAEFLRLAGLDPEEFAPQLDPSGWPHLKAKLRAVFLTRTRDEWCALLEGRDACFAPVLSMSEAPAHPHNVARGSFVTVDGVVQAAPAPRFSRTPATISRPPPEPGQGGADVLCEWGVAPRS